MQTGAPVSVPQPESPGDAEAAPSPEATGGAAAKASRCRIDNNEQFVIVQQVLSDGVLSAPHGQMGKAWEKATENLKIHEVFINKGADLRQEFVTKAFKTSVKQHKEGGADAKKQAWWFDQASGDLGRNMAQLLDEAVRQQGEAEEKKLAMKRGKDKAAAEKGALDDQQFAYIQLAGAGRSNSSLGAQLPLEEKLQPPVSGFEIELGLGCGVCLHCWKENCYPALSRKY